MTASICTRGRCPVCSFTDVRTDEVVDRGVLLLHECPRCDHRWTGRAQPERPFRERLARVGRAPSERTAA